MKQKCAGWGGGQGAINQPSMALRKLSIVALLHRPEVIWRSSWRDTKTPPHAMHPWSPSATYAEQALCKADSTQLLGRRLEAGAGGRP